MRKQVIALVLLFSVNVYAATPSSPITYNGRSGIVIDGKRFTSGANGAGINLTNCNNVTITNCEFSLNADIIGIQLKDCYNINITGNYFENFRTGVYAITCTGGINISCNSFKDIAGTYPRGQIVQFNKCSGGGNRINYNISDHTFGTGDPEDLINMYGSYGTSSDPIQIIGNKLRGGGPSTSGGGIMIGDDGGHDIRVEDNILVDVGQYGIGCPAGYNMVIKNNKVYGASKSWTNVGMYVGLQGKIDAGFPCDGPSIRVENNQIRFYNKDGNLNSFWNCPCCSGIINTGNDFNASIDASILPSTLALDPDHCGEPGTPTPIHPTLTPTNTATPAVFDIPGIVQCEDYIAGEGAGYHDTDFINEGGVYRSDGVDIQACLDTGGGYNVRWTKAGENGLHIK